MSKSKLKLDITCLTPRQRRRIFLKEFYNIYQMTINSNSLEVQNNIVNESNEPSNIEQLSWQQNVLREIDFDYSNVIHTHKFTENNDDSIFIHSGINIDENNL